MPPDIFIGHSAGDNLPAADWNSNWSLVEASFGATGPFIVTGLVPSAGTGLSVNVTAGTALIESLVTVSGFTIGGLAPSTTNHLYLLANGTGTSNTTGTAPANSVKLGTATTGVGTVTAVDTTRGTAGRQNKLSFPGQPAGTEIRLALINVGILDSGGVNSLNLNGGDLIGNIARLSGGWMGSGSPPKLPSNTITPGADADVTVTTPNSDYPWQTLVAGAWTAGHNVILPTALDAFYWVQNNSGFAATFKTAAGTGVSVANGKVAAVRCGGVNYLRAAPDT